MENSALDRKKEQFVRLLTSHERLLYAYILGLVPNWADADDILQETNVRLWSSFEKFDPQSNFAAWATSIAHYQVLTWRKRSIRTQSRMVFDDALLEEIASEHEAHLPVADRRHRALGLCIQGLSDRSRELLAQCYAPGARVKQVAEASGCKASTFYKALLRVRATLRECIERRLRSEGLA